MIRHQIRDRRVSRPARSVPTLATVLWLLAYATPSSAAPIFYTFEAPQFTTFEFAPLLNRAPNTGDPSFSTSFTSSPTPVGFTVGDFVANSLFAGNSLLEPVFAIGNVLTLEFSSPIVSLQVDFAMNLPQPGTGGHLDLLTPVGLTSQAAANVGGLFPGGTLLFSSALPFSTARLSAFVGSTPIEFAIDNLRLETALAAIPEPASLVLLGSGLAVVSMRRWRRRQRLGSRVESNVST